MAGYTDEQKTAAENYVLPAMLREYGGQSDSDISADRFSGLLGLQSAAKPGILFLGFSSQPQVDVIASALGDVHTMVTTALQQVGVSWKVSASPYEKMFGTRALRSGASYDKRVIKVRATLNAIDAGLATRWTIRRSTADDVASYSSGNKLDIGTKWPAAGGKFAAGVLIHEIGHWTGLVDVCQVCQAQQLLDQHYQDQYTTQTLRCASNTPHGNAARNGSGHFIGIKRCKLLATTQKNLTVWNTDSYRWFCSYFFQSEVNQGAAAFTRDPIAW